MSTELQEYYENAQLAQAAYAILVEGISDDSDLMLALDAEQKTEQGSDRLFFIQRHTDH